MKMSITRALAELKKVDNQISRGISTGSFLAITVGKGSNQKVYNSNSTVEQAKSQIQSSFDTLEKLFKKRDQIKSKIVSSNAQTTVSLNGRTLTVAEAIEWKTSIANRAAFLQALKSAKTNGINGVNTLNTQLEATIEKNLAAVYGSDKSKHDAGAYDMVAKPQKEAKEAALLEVYDLSKMIEEMEQTVEAVRTELDFVLSESNARTEIEIED